MKAYRFEKVLNKIFGKQNYKRKNKGRFDDLDNGGLLRLHQWSFSYVAQTTSLTRLPVNLHWLHAFKIVVLSHNVLHGTAPRYTGPLVRVSDLTGRRCLRSASTGRLVVPSFKLSAIGSRIFKVAAAQTCNGLPDDITSSPTVFIFRKNLKTHLFHLYYPDIVP